MKSILAFAAVGMLAFSAPAFAQNAGSPGASGTGPSGSGAQQPGTAGVTASPNGAVNDGAMNNGGAMKMKEGRAATKEAPAGDKADDTPRTTRGDQNGQGMAK